jgi:hypothetical protein
VMNPIDINALLLVVHREINLSLVDRFVQRG